MKLITEIFEGVQYITEAAKVAGGKPGHYIKGIFIQADVKNRNGRIYPIKNILKEVTRYTKDHVKANRAYGELGHPTGPSINLDRVSHIITELKRDDNNFLGKAKLTETPMGNIAIGLLNSGAKLGVSSRGMGSLIPGDDGCMIVQPDYHLATAADIVADPSAPQAFVEGIMENVEWFYDDKIGWVSEDLKKQLKKMSMNEIEEKQLAIFENYVASLASKITLI